MVDKGRVQEIISDLDACQHRLGMSQHRLADRMGVCPVILQALMSGKTNNGPVTAKALVAMEAYTNRPAEVEQLQLYIDHKGLASSAAAKALNMSDAQLSQILRGIYPSYSAKHKKGINRYLWREAAREDGAGQGNFQNTRNAGIVFRACNFAQIERSVVFVFGEGGSGKTIAGRRYTHENPGTIFVDTMQKESPSDLLCNIHERAFGYEGRKKAKGAIFRQIVKRLKGTDRLLIVDEANQLHADAIQTARNVADHTGVGLVLMGTRKLSHKLTEMDPSREGEFAQLFSRAVRFQLTKARREDTARIVGDFIKNPSKAVVDALHEFGNQNARSVVKLIRLVHEAAKKENTKISPELIEKESNSLVLGTEALAEKTIKRMRKR